MTFPPIPVYPFAIDSDRTLFLVYNTAEAELAADNLPWSQEIQIEPVAADKDEIWADNGFANISGELFYYDTVEKNIDGKVFKLKRCARNLGGSQTKLNLAGVWVRGFVVAEHHNQIVDAILNIEQFVGINFSEDRETLDWRIRNLALEPIGDDDFQCPNVTLEFNITDPSTDGSVGTVVNYTLTIDGFFKTFLLDFGDGNFTTSAQTGTHTYAPNAKIDPVVTVSNDNCQVVQTAIIRDEPEEPEVGAQNEPFEIDVPEPLDFPQIVIPNIEVPDTTLTLPPIQFPCELGIGPIGSIGDLPSLILVSDDIPLTIEVIGDFNFPSVISFTPVNIPSVISITPVNIPSLITFTPINLPSIIAFTPVDIPSIITVLDSIPTVIDVNFPSVITITDISINLPSVISVYDDIPTTVTVSVNDDIPTTITVTDSIPVTISITDDIPTTISVTADPIPSVISVYEDIPTTITVNDSVPSTITVTDSIPNTVSVTDDIPNTISLTDDIPATINVNDSIPSTINVNDDIPASISVYDDIPNTITITGCSIPSTINVNWGSPPTIPVVFGPCNCNVTVTCPSSGGFRSQELGEVGAAFNDPFVDPNMEMQLTAEDVGIPSEIKIVAPTIPDIKVVHQIPEFISVLVPEIADIKIIGPAVPIPSEIKIHSDVVIPSQIELVSDVPKAIVLDASQLPATIRLEVPDEFPTIKIEGDIPKTIQVVGIPDTIELKGTIPSEINVNFKVPEGLEIPIVYKGGPLPVQFDLVGPAGNEDGKRPCFALVPCGEQ